MARFWVVDSVGWHQLQAILKSTGGSTIGPFDENIGEQLNELGDDIGVGAADQGPIWTTAHRTAQGWFWGDGTAIEKSFWREGDPNGDDDPSNDTSFAVLSGNSLTAGDEGTIVLTSDNGTQYRDYSDSIVGNGAALQLFGGDDYFHGGGYGVVTIDAGAGDDQIILDDYETTQTSTIIDGDGSDYVAATRATIKATPDGDQDQFFTEGRITYGAGTTGLILEADGSLAVVSSDEFGADIIGARHVVGTNFNDRMAGVDRLSGGKGDDVLTPRLFAEGGDGNDTLIADASERVELRGEAGNDRLVLISSAKVGGGAGLDTFVFEGIGHATINDLQAGEVIDLSALLDVAKPNAISDGFLKQSQSGGYTHLWIDLDGGGDSWLELISAKGIVDVYDHLVF